MTRIIDPIEAIVAINPAAKAGVKEGDIDQITWNDGTAPIAKADIEAKVIELQAEADAEDEQKATDKTSAKAKLIAGEALTEAEADTIVL